MEKTMLLETIGDTLENRIIDFLVGGIGMDYTKKNIADGCGISRPSVYKVLPNMVKNGVVSKTRTIGRSQLYTLNRKNEKVMALLKLEGFLLSKAFAEMENLKEKPKIRA